MDNTWFHYSNWLISIRRSHSCRSLCFHNSVMFRRPDTLGIHHYLLPGIFFLRECSGSFPLSARTRYFMFYEKTMIFLVSSRNCIFINSFPLSRMKCLFSCSFAIPFVAPLFVKGNSSIAIHINPERNKKTSSAAVSTLTTSETYEQRFTASR